MIIWAALQEDLSSVYSDGYTVVILHRQFAYYRFLRCYSKITFEQIKSNTKGGLWNRLAPRFDLLATNHCFFCTKEIKSDFTCVVLQLY